MLSDKEKRKIEVFGVFRKRKILTMSKLLEILGCSERTIQRRLKNWNVYTSYNRNGRYYTLSDIPRFDRHGIWKFNGVFFSKYGNLKNTVIAVVKRSNSGLSARELGEITGLSSYAFLSHFKSVSDIEREKRRGVYIYFSSDPDEFAEQKRERNGIVHPTAPLDLPSDGDAIGILVELIRNPADDIDRLARRIRRKGISVPTSKITNLLAYHGILKKNL
ncbi:MAG: hypothetical protein GY866_39220 [Proteobacteria bacterium]|nr:hypothetical protein [Pseudomonadota bacterium]